MKNIRESELTFEDVKIHVSSEQNALLFTFVKELNSWNKRINLTGLPSTKRILDELVADSLMPLPYFPATGICLDVGSGAGFPAIPLKICRPTLKFFLVEPNSKKGSFLKHIIRTCRLQQIEIIRERIEKPSRPFSFTKVDVITSRAMAPLPKLITWCTPFLAPGGLMVAFLGKEADEILEKSKSLMEEKDLIIHDSRPYTLKERRSERHLLVLKKR